MSKKIVRVGDINEKGGRVLQGDNTVFLNGRPIAVEGMPVSPHPAQPYGRGNHVGARTRATESSIFVNGKRIILVGDTDTCGHKRIDGSPDVGL